MRPPAMTGSSSDPHAAVPYHGRPSLGQTPTSQLGGTEFQVPHPGAAGLSARVGPAERSSIAQPVPKPIQLGGTSVSPPANGDTRQTIEGFSDFLRKRAILSTHSSEPLVTTIQNINGTIGFEYQSGWYRTNWIGERFRIVLSRTVAEERYGACQCMSSVNEHAITHTDSTIVQPFKRDSSEIAGLFANQGLFASIHANGYGGITPVAEDIEIHWKTKSLFELRKECSIFRSGSMYCNVLSSRNTGPQTPPAIC